MNGNHQDLKTSLDDISVYLRSALETTVNTRKFGFIDSLRQASLAQIRQYYVPSTTTELAQLTASSQEAFSILGSLEEAIAQTDRLLSFLKKAEKITRDAYDCTHGLLHVSPIYKLPTEILTQIFDAYIFASGGSDYSLSIDEGDHSTDDEGEDLFYYDISCPSLQLGWICNRWRQIVLSKPAYWSSIFLRCRFSESSVALCEEFLSRSGDSPLKLHIEEKLKHRRIVPNPVERLLNMLLDHSARWSELALNLHPQWFLYTNRRLDLVKSPGGHRELPNLKHLDLAWCPKPPDYNDPNDDDNEFRHIDHFISFLKLETYVDSKLDWPNFILFDFSCLTRLSLSTLVGTQIAPFLSHLPVLKSFRLCCFEENDGHGEPVVHEFSHNTLSSLDLMDASFRPNSWHGIQLPQVDTLKLEAYSGALDEEGRSRFLSLSSLLHQSRCILHTLKLARLPLSLTLEMLKQHPSVADLTVYPGPRANVDELSDFLVGLFDALQGTEHSIESRALVDGHPVMVPKLHSLTIVLFNLSQLPDPVHSGWLDKLARFVD